MSDTTDLTDRLAEAAAGAVDAMARTMQDGHRVGPASRRESEGPWTTTRAEPRRKSGGISEDGRDPMSHRPGAAVHIIALPHLHPEAIRVEIECRYSATGLTSIPGPLFALTREQLITSAVFEHEARCGECDTEVAHERGDREIRVQTERAWNDFLVTVQRRYDLRSREQCSLSA